jgi:hypothetical protein
MWYLGREVRLGFLFIARFAAWNIPAADDDENGHDDVADEEDFIREAAKI